MCPECEGIGRVSTLDVDQLVDRTKSLNEGALLVPNFRPDHWYGQIFISSGLFDPDMKLADYTPEQWHDLLYKPLTKIKVGKSTISYEGLVVKVQRVYLNKERESMQSHIGGFVDRAVTFTPCPLCHGTRLNQAALRSKIDGRNIADCSAMQINELADVVRKIDDPAVAPMVTALRETLDSLVDIGLGYLSLDRESGTLSGGEAQRVKMVRHLGSPLTDVTYVFDEPTVGLHPHDIQRMNELLLLLRDKGNTVLVVEHKPETIAIADHVVDLGPGAGAAGGQVCFSGTVEALRASGTLTGRYLDHRATLKGSVRTPTGYLSVSGATAHNLRDVSVDIPLGVLTVVTGVAGSGKSSLIHGYVSTQEGVSVADQSPIRGSRRSNPATYTGLLDPLRAAFAKANGVKAALFSANSAGACPGCKGIGLVYTDLAMMAGVASVCEQCEGKRYLPEVLRYKLRGKDISEVLAMSVVEARSFVQERAASAVLTRLVDVGLGYLRLGQPLNTLSGGERQRLKLAIHMAEKASVYVLDEPTTGLHLADVDQLLGLLDRLVDAGNSVIVIEHHQAVMAHADWVVDLANTVYHEARHTEQWFMIARYLSGQGYSAAGIASTMGIPARYVSGYLHPKPDGQLKETVQGESHAWIEAWTGGCWGTTATSCRTGSSTGRSRTGTSEVSSTPTGTTICTTGSVR
ncbi:ATP-binding cassette domain-containing protein, partial [Kibdelosporangium lantanae]